MATRIITRNGMLAALYAALTLAVAPIGFGPIQCRVSEMLKVAVLFDVRLVLGLTVGTFIANWFSPYAGVWELVWMPVTDMLGGLLAWAVYQALGRRLIVIPCALFAMTTALSVALMLWMLGVGAFWFLVSTVLVGELIAIFGGLPVMMKVKTWILN